MSTDALSLITSLVPSGTRTPAARHGEESADGGDVTASPSLSRGVAVLAVVPEWVLQGLVGHLKGAIARAASELDRLDIRLCLDVRRAPAPSSPANGESLETLEGRMLDLVAEVNRLRRA